LKKCSVCKLVKPLAEFYWRKKENKPRNECKQCSKDYCKKWYTTGNNAEISRNRYKLYRLNNLEKTKLATLNWRNANKEKVKISQREYRKKDRSDNPEKYKIKRRKQYEKNLVKEREDNKQYRANNKDKIRELSKKWARNNPDKIKESCRKYRANNREKINKKKLLYTNRTITSRLNSIIKGAIYKSLRSNKQGRHWEDIVGYTLIELKQHLESKFQEGMTWDNQGKWHIDHIIPQSLWQFSSYEDREFKQCWALCNLQPLWAEDNIRKHNKTNFGVK